jgi:hypothetical protein
MSRPGILWWQKYGTLAQMAPAAGTLLGLKNASVTPPDCKLGKT